jgi:UDP-N-acetyl-D-mannosaminuronic acid dehydrogenase
MSLVQRSSLPTHVNIVVIGMGYVGIPCAALLADVDDFRVTGVQRRSERSGWKIDWLNAGKCPFAGDEPGLARLIQRVVLEKGAFRVTDDISVCRKANVILIDVQTPVDKDHVPRYESLCQVSEQVGQHLQPGTLVIIESTVAPGTTQHLVQPVLEETSGLKAGRDFYLAFSYERVMPGRLMEYIVNFPRVVGGIDDKSTELAVELYRHIVKDELWPTDCLTAEVAKTVENAYRDVSIAFANEVALACERLGVDVFEVRELINARPDRHMHLPGAGVGGHCLPKDSWLLKYGLETYGTEPMEMVLIPLARWINDGMPAHMAELIEKGLAEVGVELAGAKVAVLGVAYLENCDDTRNTPAARLVTLLEEHGATVVAHDPYVWEADWQLALGPGSNAPLARELEEALRGADCAVVVTRHRQYEGLDLSWARKLMRSPLLVDGRNVFTAQTCEQAGFVYRGVGKGNNLTERENLAESDL